MTLQSQVYTTVAVGVPGSKADANTFDYYPQSLTAKADITAGTFVWSEPNEKFGDYGGTDSPLGFVERNIVYPNYNIMEDGSMVIGKGETLTVATLGAFYAVTTTVATVGQSVFALSADGTIATDVPGATVSGAVETAWKVVTPGDADETIIIKRS